METTKDGSGQDSHRAGLFDIRIMIAALIGLYGVILVVAGLFTSEAEQEKAAGLNINIWAGIGMLVAAGGFALWARLRPIVVPDEPEATEESTGS